MIRSFEDFQQAAFTTSDNVNIHYVIGGQGPALLLLHGYPQNHRMWWRIAPGLAQRYTLIMPDLRGYGDSGKPESDAVHSPYSFKRMAQDQAELMQALGHEKYTVIGHDRGARVTHRFCLDYPDRVTKAIVMDIAPTLYMYETMGHALIQDYFHWAFLTQASPFPETMIAHDPEAMMRILMGNDDQIFPPAIFADYLRCFQKPETLFGVCEDYRAAATIDLVHHREDKQSGHLIQCPLLVMIGGKGVIAKHYDSAEIWARETALAPKIQMIDAGHFLAEEKAADCLHAIMGFLRSD